MLILIVAATSFEVEPLVNSFGNKLDVLITGAGMVPTAFALGRQFNMHKYDLVINLGIAGSFDRSITPGYVVEITEDTFAETGAEDDQEFIPITTLGFGENPEREGLLKTPERMAKAMLYLTHGYDLDAKEILNSAMFKEDYSQMVIVKDIEVYSMCEHHMLPFFGKAHIAYIPNGYVVGLSKIPRIVDVFARRLQVQERLTNEIRDCIQDTLNPIGVGVVIECRHLCMSMRGVQKQNSVTTTSAFTGEFLKEKTRTEFLNLISAKLG